jgi:hypothetical protein
MQRRPIKYVLSFPVRLEQEAKSLTYRAHKLQPGRERDKMLSKARQLEVAVDINEWLSSPGLQAPK